MPRLGRTPSQAARLSSEKPARVGAASSASSRVSRMGHAGKARPGERAFALHHRGRSKPIVWPMTSAPADEVHEVRKHRFEAWRAGEIGIDDPWIAVAAVGIG